MISSPAAIYLAAAIRAFLAGDNAPPLPPAVDADDLVDTLVTRHLAATLGPVLPAATLPAAAAARLRVAQEAAELRTTVLLLELERVLPALEAAGAEPVALKGAALALDVYPAPSRRWFVDLDILVPAARRDEAVAALGRLGYRRHDAGRHPDYYDRHHFHRMMINPSGVCVELHWDVTLARSIFGYEPEIMRQQARRITFADRSLRVAGCVDQLLHGALQSVAEGFADTRRVIDAGLVAPRLTAEELAELVGRARRYNLGPALWLQLRMLEEIGGYSMPSAVAKLAPARWVRRALAAIPVAECSLVGRFGQLAGYSQILHWLCAPTSALRWREIKRHLWPTTAGLLELGYRPEAPPGFGRRVWMSLRRLKELVWLGAALAVRSLTTRRAHPRADRP